MAKRRSIHCPKCRYDLSGLTGDVCPECGGAFVRSMLRPGLRRWKLRRWLTATLLLALVPSIMHSCL